MCGICGAVSTKAHDMINPMVIASMNQAIEHRGPDEVGYYIQGPVGLGHRRLSIIDLESGRQPISNEDESVWIVSNGEIYNYRHLRQELIEKGHHFKTQSDAEVIVHLYEELQADCVKKLRGMFAFAIWDKKRSRLFMARDRLGQKPLFYSTVGRSFVFASESKAILEFPGFKRKLNPLAVHDFLSFKFIPRQTDLICGIHKLPPASTLTWENSQYTISKYWELYFQPDMQMGVQDAIDRTEAILKESVDLRMMSDVPLGAYLSSGLDSGLVVGFMSQLSNAPINSFSIGNREKGFNELPGAKHIAESFNTNHHELRIDPNVIQILPDLIWHLDGPYADIPAIPMYYVAKLARENVTVVLTGDGGDESFAGYDRYIANLLLVQYRKIPGPVRKQLVPSLLNLFSEKTARKSWRQTLRWFNDTSLHPSRESYARGISFFSFENEQKEALYTPEFAKSVESANSHDGLLDRYWSDHATDPLNRMMYTDLMVRMAEYSNVKVDRISMMHSLEARSPFMDHHLVEFAATIPPGLKIKNRQRKHIIRKITEKQLPQGIVNLPKKGFSSPINQWLRGPLSYFASHLLRNSTLVDNQLFQASYIDNLLRDHMRKRFNNGTKIWGLINLEVWHRIFMSDQRPVDALGQVKKSFLRYQ